MKIEAIRLVHAVREILNRDMPEAEVLAAGLLEEMRDLLVSRSEEVQEEGNLDDERLDTLHSIEMTVGMLDRLISDIRDKTLSGSQ